MSISYNGSIEYFSNHVYNDVWTKAGEVACTRAIVHARRVLSSALKRKLEDDEDAYVEGDTMRDEYAVYEQALFMIANGIISNGDGATPIGTLDVNEKGEARDVSRQTIAPEALRWLGVSGGSAVYLVKG